MSGFASLVHLDVLWRAVQTIVSLWQLDLWLMMKEVPIANKKGIPPVVLGWEGILAVQEERVGGNIVASEMAPPCVQR